jgi:hypothetical protein
VDPEQPPHAPVPQPDGTNPEDEALLADSVGLALNVVLDPDVVLRSDGGTALPEVSVVLHGPAAVVDHGFRIHDPAAMLWPVLVNGAVGMVVILRGQLVAVAGFTVSHGKVTEIDILADPERLARIDLASLA